MAISTNSIIHYTKTFENLEGILQNGFHIYYCAEKIQTKENAFVGAVAMASFCDIPLSEIKAHINNYGSYGIGLTKEWAKHKQLNPIIYFERNSHILNYYYSEMNRLNEKLKVKEIKMDDLNHLFVILSYSKNYEGLLEKTGQTDYRFYDEREWRYVPPINIVPGVKPFIAGTTYQKDKEKYNDTLSKVTLAFEPTDISYIIVKDESDIMKVARSIRHIFYEKCSAAQLEILLTRIITTEQINNDF